MNKTLSIILTVVLLVSCTSKKEILYLQDIDSTIESAVNYDDPIIQPNDILKITVITAVPEAAIPYNNVSPQGMPAQNIQLLQLDGYLVSLTKTIIFPVLGEISVADKTTSQLAMDIKTRLETGGHLSDPNVSVRLLNAKVTILGEVNQPGTFNFTEQNITVLQALGYAGDLTIRGKRDDILITREVEGVRRISHMDLTSANFMASEFYFVKPNDVIIVNPNDPRVKNAGYISDIGILLTIMSLGLSIAILVSR